MPTNGEIQNSILFAGDLKRIALQSDPTFDVDSPYRLIAEVRNGKAVVSLKTLRD